MNTCFECDGPAEHDHHVVPQSRGGTRTVPLCGPCHAKAHHVEGWVGTPVLIKEALAAKRARGEVCGTPRRGFRKAAVKGAAIPDQHEMAIVAEARRLRAKGRKLREIRDDLAARGMLNRKGNPFALPTLHRMVAA